MGNAAEDDDLPEMYLREKKVWKAGKRRNWFYPAEATPHVRLFWDAKGQPSMEYTNADTAAVCMVRNGQKLENYSLGIQELEEELGGAFKRNVVNDAFVAMRNWPRGDPSGRP